MVFPSRVVTQLHGSNGNRPRIVLPCLNHILIVIGPVHALTYSSSPSTYILTGSADRSIRLYNPSRPSQPQSQNNLTPPKPTQLIQTYSAHGYTILSLTVSNDNATFASAGGDRSVFLWDVATAKTLRRFGGNQGHTSRINSVTFAGDNDAILISGGYDASVRIWDIRQHTSHKPIMVLTEAKDSISAVLAARDGGATSYEILAGSVDGRVRTYDIRMGKMEEDTIGASVTSLTRTRDGKGVLVGCLDSSIRLMDRDNGGLLKRYEGFTNNEYRLESTFGANERYVLCGNEIATEKSNTNGIVSGEVVVWDTVSGKVVERVCVPGNSSENRKRVVGNDGKEKERQNIISCLAWKENGRGDQWCCAGTDGVVTVFGPP